MNSPSSSKKKAYSLKSFRVLIAEDYAFMADLVASMLREFGVGHLLLASDGQEAKEMIMMFNADARSSNHIDLLVTDWLMPRCDGEELVRWIRSSSKDGIRFMPVILCSAYTNEKVVTTARDCGANEALVKPVSAKKLADRILHVIDNPRSFVKAPGFFGPDRRRREQPFKGEDRRVTTTEEIKEYNERL